MQTPVMVMSTNSRRETGRKAQLANIQAAKVKRLKRMPLCIFFFLISFNYCRQYHKLLPQPWDPRLC